MVMFFPCPLPLLGVLVVLIRSRVLEGGSAGCLCLPGLVAVLVVVSLVAFVASLAVPVGAFALGLVVVEQPVLIVPARIVFVAPWFGSWWLIVDYPFQVPPMLEVPLRILEDNFDR